MRTIASLLLAVVSSAAVCIPAHCQTIYSDAGAPRTTLQLSETELTWARYWEEHRIQDGLTKPIRWCWHRGPEQIWSKTGLPIFRSYCAFGKWSERTGFTAGLSATGAAANVGTTAIVGAKKF